MKLKSILSELELSPEAGKDYLDRNVERGYVSDMMSDVIANCKKGDLWITFQTHLNIAAVASMREIAAVIFIKGRRPGQEVLKKADEMKLPLICSDMTAYELAGRLYKMGIPG